MKNLNEYIKESLLDNEEDLVSNSDIEDTQWVKDNYKISAAGRHGTEEFFVKNGILNAPNTSFSLKVDLKNLTNGNFKFGEVYEFNCCSIHKLKNLVGGPTKVNGSFDCINCGELKDLTGAPGYVGGEFDCSNCDNLKTLAGAPKYVGSDFNCSECPELKTLKDLPKNIEGDLYIDSQMEETLRLNSGQVKGDITCVN